MTEKSRQINEWKEYVKQLNKRRGFETEEFQRLVREAGKDDARIVEWASASQESGNMSYSNPYVATYLLDLNRGYLIND